MNTPRVLGAILGTHIDLCGAGRAAAVVVGPAGEVLASWGRDAGPDTVFRIASMTKSFTAAAVLSLRDEGMLDLHTSVATYAPELAHLVGPGVDPASVSLRHLLTMSSGLATDDPWADRHLDATDDDLDGWISGGLRFSYPTGTAFEYSNLGYALVGRVVHRVTGTRLQHHVRERFLSPLGMSRTGWSVGELPNDADVTQGMHVIDGVQSPTAPLGDGVVAPMGGLWSCARDLGLWMAFLSSAFTSSPRPGQLSASSRREMQQLHRETPVRRLTAVDGSSRIAEGGYAMGLTTYADDRLGRVVTHSGGLPGYGSNMRWVPGGVGVASLANVTYAPMWHASAAVLDALGVAGLIHAPQFGAPDELRVAAHRLVALLTSWDDSIATDLFADNVLEDAPADARQREADARVGSPKGAVVSVIAVEAAGDAAATVTFVVGASPHRVRLELSPLAQVTIQKYDWL